MAVEVGLRATLRLPCRRQVLSPRTPDPVPLAFAGSASGQGQNPMGVRPFRIDDGPSETHRWRSPNEFCAAPKSGWADHERENNLRANPRSSVAGVCAETAAAALVWIVGTANDLFEHRTGGMQVRDLGRHLRGATRLTRLSGRGPPPTDHHDARQLPATGGRDQLKPQALCSSSGFRSRGPWPS
jgi:hypothetical protein